MFFRYLQDEEYIEANLAKKVRWQKEEKVIIKSFNDKEVSRMLKVYNYTTYLQARNKCMIALLFDTGIRNLELCSIKCEDIMSNAILIHGKGSKQRFVPITPSLAKIMLKYEQSKKEVYM